MNKIHFDALTELLKAPSKTAIICHRNPDPDTLGSAAGLSCILKHFGSDVSIICADKLPKRLSFITKGEEILYEKDLSEFERVIAVDVASPSQMGELSVYADKVDFTIDHHEMSTRFSDYYMENCPACAQIIFKIASFLGLYNKLPKEFFEAIYAGISGDTGCFKYSNVTSETHVIASKLVNKNIDYAEINRLIFDSSTFGEINVQRLTYSNMRLWENGRLSTILLTNEMKKANSVSDEDVGDIVNHIRRIEGVLVSVSIKQSSKNEKEYFISSRANVDIDVSDACAVFGGGGHPRAAGCTITADSPEDAEKMVVSVFAKRVSEYGR